MRFSLFIFCILLICLNSAFKWTWRSSLALHHSFFLLFPNWPDSLTKWLGFLFVLLWVCLFCSQKGVATIHPPGFLRDSFGHFIFSGRFVTFVGVGHLVLTSAVRTHSFVISWHWTLPCRNLTSAWYFPSYRWLTFFLLRGLHIHSLSLNFSYLSGACQFSQLLFCGESSNSISPLLKSCTSLESCVNSGTKAVKAPV